MLYACRTQACSGGCSTHSPGSGTCPHLSDLYFFLKPALQTAKDEHLLLSPLNGLTPALVLVLADGQRLPQPMEGCCLYPAPIPAAWWVHCLASASFSEYSMVAAAQQGQGSPLTGPAGLLSSCEPASKVTDELINPRTTRPAPPPLAHPHSSQPISLTQTPCLC